MVILSSLAENKLKKIHRVDQLYIIKKLKNLEAGTDPAGTSKLKGCSLLRSRVGHYRIIYERQKNKIYVPIIAHRREVYHLLKRLF